MGDAMTRSGSATLMEPVDEPAPPPVDDLPEQERSSTILIGDDDAAIRSLLTDLLESEGYHTATAKSGTEVMRQARSEPPDLIILDLRMPDLTGIEIMRRLRDEGLSIPVLLICASAASSSTSASPPKSASSAPVSKAAIPPSASSAPTRPCRRSTRPSAGWRNPMPRS
jgi:CheY-like chemotaxis protein